MPEEIMKEMHLKIGEKELERIDVLAEYYYTLGLIKKPNRAELVRYALNCLHSGTRREIESRRYGVK